MSTTQYIRLLILCILVATYRLWDVDHPGVGIHWMHSQTHSDGADIAFL